MHDMQDATPQACGRDRSCVSTAPMGAARASTQPDTFSRMVLQLETRSSMPRRLGLSTGRKYLQPLQHQTGTTEHLSEQKGLYAHQADPGLPLYGQRGCPDGRVGWPYSHCEAVTDLYASRLHKRRVDRGGTPSPDRPAGKRAVRPTLYRDSSHPSIQSDSSSVFWNHWASDCSFRYVPGARQAVSTEAQFCHPLEPLGPGRRSSIVY